jgi:hypothetical protein
MKQPVILSVIALVSTVTAASLRPPEFHFPHKFTISGVIFSQNTTDDSDRTFLDGNDKIPLTFRLHVDSENNRKLQVFEKTLSDEKYYAYSDFSSPFTYINTYT